MREELDVKDAQLHEVLSSSEDGSGRAAGRNGQKLLSQTRNVVRDQDRRIQALEREILMMRQRARWGDEEAAAAAAESDIRGKRSSSFSRILRSDYPRISRDSSFSRIL